jgi:hypothetical protein
MSKSLYYRHSGKFRLNAPTTMLSGGAVAALALGGIYGLLVALNPFIYVNAAALAIACVSMGAVLSKLAMWTHTRQPILVLLIGFICGLVALYAAWVAWLIPVLGWRYLVWEPWILRELIPHLAEEGVWGFGPGMGGPPKMVKGEMLWAIWGAEAVLIVMVATFAPWMNIRQAVYCERCGEWVNREERIQSFAPVPRKDELRRRLESGDIAALLELEPVPDEATEYTRYVLKWCESCDTFNLLSVWTGRMFVGSKGEAKFKAEAIVKDLFIDAQARKMVVSLAPVPEPSDEARAETPPPLPAIEGDPDPRS